MPPRPDSPYDPVASVAPSTQAPSDYIHSEASAADFGGQVGGALQQAGQTGEKLGAQGMDLATQQQGLINQSLAQNAETDYVTKLSAITDKYKTLQGLDAVAGHTQAVADITALRQQTLANIPTGGAQRAFNTLAQRHEAYAVSDVGTYWAQQVKAGAVASSQAMTSNSVARTGTADVAADDARFNYHLQSAVLGLNDMMSNRGYGAGMTIDPKTGAASYDTSTPEGKAAQDIYTEKYNEIVSKAWDNRIHALADDPNSGSVSKALSVFNANKDQIPPQAQMELSAYLKPKLRTVDAATAASTALQSADSGYQAAVTGAISSAPPGSRPNADQIGAAISKQEGTGTSVQGAVDGIMPATFTQYARPGESFDSAADRATVNKRIISNLSQKYGNDPARVAVAYFSGPGNVAPPGSPNPWINDAKDGNGKSVSAYVTDVMGRIGGNGIVSKADYYRTNAESIINQARTLAQQKNPDDPMAAEYAASRAQQQISSVIRQQDLSYKADSDLVFQAANGDLAKGTHPMTIDQLTATSPAVAQAWDRLQAQQPQVAHEVATRLLTENARTNGGDVKTYGPAFYNVFNRIHSDGPNKVTDPTQLYGLVGQPDGLTMAGLVKAREEINGRNTPDGEAESRMKAQFFHNAHGVLTGTNDGLGLKDPHGEEIYLKFMAAAYPAIEAAKSAGKSPAQIYDPNSPDYVGKLINGMKRSPAQYQSDLMSANGEGSAPAQTAAKQYARADLEAEMMRRGLLKQNLPPAETDNGPQVPH